MPFSFIVTSLISDGSKHEAIQLSNGKTLIRYQDDSKYEAIQLLNGKTLIRYQGYLFSFQGSKSNKNAYLYCSRRTRSKCPARLKLNPDKDIVSALTDHNHSPPYLQKLSDGRFVKLE